MGIELIHGDHTLARLQTAGHSSLWTAGLVGADSPVKRDRFVGSFSEKLRIFAGCESPLAKDLAAVRALHRGVRAFLDVAFQIADFYMVGAASIGVVASDLKKPARSFSHEIHHVFSRTIEMSGNVGRQLYDQMKHFRLHCGAVGTLSREMTLAMGREVLRSCGCTTLRSTGHSGLRMSARSIQPRQNRCWHGSCRGSSSPMGTVPQTGHSNSSTTRESTSTNREGSMPLIAWDGLNSTPGAAFLIPPEHELRRKSDRARRAADWSHRG